MTNNPSYNVLYCMIGFMIIDAICMSIYLLIFTIQLIKKKQDNDKKINSYLPCVAFNKTAELLSTLSVGDDITIKGECRSRYYKKNLDNGEYEMRIAHELLVREVVNG